MLNGTRCGIQVFFTLVLIFNTSYLFLSAHVPPSTRVQTRGLPLIRKNGKKMLYFIALHCYFVWFKKLNKLRPLLLGQIDKCEKCLICHSHKDLPFFSPLGKLPRNHIVGCVGHDYIIMRESSTRTRPPPR